MHKEINERMASKNLYYYLLKLFKSKLLSKESKRALYSSYLRPVMTYGCETSATTKSSHYNKLSTTEIKNFREIFVPVYNIETEIYKRGHNADL